MNRNVLTKIVLLLGLLGFMAGQAGAQTQYIDTNSVWRAETNGTDLGTTWTAPLYDDSLWASGPGVLGFGDAWIRTTIGRGAFITYYFRHTFNVTGAASILSLSARHMRDDGLVVYLNGTEAFRDNMPAGAVIFTTPAGGATAPENAFRTNNINPALLVEGDNTIAVEVHQNLTSSSDLTFYLELVGASTPPVNVAPTVAVSNPANGDILIQDYVSLHATAADSDGTVAQVAFYEGDTLLGTDPTAAPYAAVLSGVAAGSHTYTAVATDNEGLSTTSAPVTVTVVAPVASLIPLGATWKYLDDGTDQSLFYNQAGFDDSTWASGRAELGYGDNDEVTLVNGGPTTARLTTTYFRHTFNVADPASITSLALRLVRDDGVLVYLNGNEIFRNNLTNEFGDPLFTYLSTALVAVEDAPIIATNLDASVLNFLVLGNNVLAAEIHQQSATSSDISFDLQLIANAGANPPVVAITAPTNGFTVLNPAVINVAATAYDIDGQVEDVTFYLDGTIIGTPDTTVGYGRSVTNIPAGPHTFRAVARDNSGLTSADSVVNFTVFDGPVTTTLLSTGLVWKYLDDGSDQGTAWQALAFDDSLWASGPAELGFGDGPALLEATLISQTNSAGVTNITFYFRHAFTSTGPGSATNLIVRLRRDDGGIVYINGVEVFRSNMPVDPITYQTLAVANTTSETAFFTTNVNPSVLVNGQNIIAVEVHQNAVNSSDTSFDLQLDAVSPPGPARPRLSITLSFGEATLSWSNASAGDRLECAPTVLGPWTTAASQVNGQMFTVDPNAAPKFFRVVNP